MNYWVITDPHFGHNKLVTAGHRPANFEEKILKSLQDVNPADVLICLGDFAFYQEEYWNQRFMDSVKGKRWLVKGNHDRRSMVWYLERGWDFVGHSISLKIFGCEILMTHKPVIDLGEAEINLHGHLHNNPDRHAEYDRSITHRLLVMEDHYKPVKLQQLVM